MSTNLFLNWAILAISLFNAVLLLWLGLTVWLTADQRNWGITMACASLLLGALFFMSHSVIIALGLPSLSWRSMVFWWGVATFPLIVMPFAWYVVILWYTGFWQQPPLPVRQRQLYGFGITLLLLLAGLVSMGVGMAALTMPLTQTQTLRTMLRWSVAGIPLMAVGYSIFVLLCMGLSMDALRQPTSSKRVMGDVARQRARPYLVSASLVLMMVSLLVTAVLLWAVEDTRRRTFFDIYLSNRDRLARLDLIISLLIALVVVLVGQAVVSYEVFTGKSLPRRGLLRHWHRAILLAAGLGIVVGGMVGIQLRPVYAILVTVMTVGGFYAVVSWRSYAERQLYMDQLRPFISGHHMLDQLLHQTTPPQTDMFTPFQALCIDLLDTQTAFLIPLGPMAPLVGRPLTYPPQTDAPPVSQLNKTLNDPALATDTAVLPIDPTHYQNAIWAVPLWNDRGLSGVLLLGEKTDGGLYTQEEIELARLIGERLIDTQASTEMARRLMMLQRERMAQSQIIDQQTRRVLHDDILPNLQASLIALSPAQPGATNTQEAITLVTEAHKQISDLLHNMPTITIPDVAHVGLVKTLIRSVENEFAHAFDEIIWQIRPSVTSKIHEIPTLTAEVLFYAAREAIRNAAKHGRPYSQERPFILTIQAQWENTLCLTIRDNGIGFTQSEPARESISGHGLALHSTMMAVIGGTLMMESIPGEGTTVILKLAA